MTVTGFAPFQMVYGESNIMLVELEIKLLKMIIAMDLDLPEAYKEMLE
jgi:hypothetical protein